MKRMMIFDIVATIIFVIGAVIFGVSCFKNGTFTILSRVGISIAIAGIVFDFITQRCPSCKHFLGVLFCSTKRHSCPFCGYKIND